MKHNILVICILALALHVSAKDEYMSQHWGIENGLTQNTVSAILQDREGFMWFGTWDGLNRFNGYEFEDFRPIMETRINTRIRELYETPDSTLWWITYSNELYSLNKYRTKVVKRTEQEVPSGLIDKWRQTNDTLRIGPRGTVWQVDDKPGIMRYRNGNWKRLIPPSDERFKGSARKNMIFLEDKQGRLWVNPTGGGFGYYDPDKDEIVNPLRMTSTIHEAYIDREGLMWLASFDKGIDCLNFAPQPFVVHDFSEWRKSLGEVRAMYEDEQELVMEKLDERMIYSITRTPKGLLYGSRNNGITDRYGNKVGYTTNCNAVYDLLYTDNLLLAATYGGGINVFYPDGSRQVVADGANVRCLRRAGEVLYAGTTMGILRLRKDLSQDTIPCNDVRCLEYTDKYGLLVGTFGSGLFQLVQQNGKDTLILHNTGVHVITAMVYEDDKVYMTSETGITVYNLSTGEQRYFSPLERARMAYFSEAKALKRHDGVIQFGFSQGYIEFDPSKVRPLGTNVPLKIMHVTSIMEQKNWHETIVLPHNRNSFTVQYAALEYANPDQIRYRYMLQGHDRQWNEVGQKREASYTNLHPGDYTFRVQSTNRAGEWCDNEQQVHFVVEQTIWLSWWMWLIYLMVFAGIIQLAIILSRRHERLMMDIHQGEELNQAKLNFFTNISHELRTPMTLITGPVENILRTENLTPTMRKQLEIVDTNGKRMLRLINQILDFRKVQNKKMRLKVEQVDLNDLIHHSGSHFLKEANDRNITLSIENRSQQPIAWCDRQNMDTVVFNLLSNAFKYTEDGKHIWLMLDERPGYHIITVRDEGKGIDRDRHSSIFERFKSDTNQTPTNRPGTGIGLSLVKDIVDLHHGFIELESEPGKGSSFIVMLRSGKNHFGQDVDFVASDLSTNSNKVDNPSESNEVVADRQRKLILVVDDNDDMRTFLTTLLENEFDIIGANDGVQALPLATNQQPDLIISDLMMPNMDGLQLLEHIKTQEATNHLPIILLTAKSAIDSRLSAMNIGADDYITKPFEPEYLVARVKNIIDQREKLEAKYRERLLQVHPHEEETMPEPTPQDAFLRKLMAVMDKEMDNNAFSVDELVEAIGMGRTVFFNKLKSITGMSPVEFIREIRIKRAAQLLTNPQYNISEVAYMVGLNDARYFSKCFKQTYHMTPSEYRKQYMPK